MKSPAPTSSTNDTATCETTSTLPPVRCIPRDCVVRAAAFKAGVRSVRADRNAGAMPNKTPVNSETAVVKSNIPVSGEIESRIGRLPVAMNATR